jgi:hypothetical protein
VQIVDILLRRVEAVLDRRHAAAAPLTDLALDHGHDLVAGLVSGCAIRIVVSGGNTEQTGEKAVLLHKTVERGELLQQAHGRLDHFVGVVEHLPVFPDLLRIIIGFLVVALQHVADAGWYLRILRKVLLELRLAGLDELFDHVRLLKLGLQLLNLRQRRLDLCLLRNASLQQRRVLRKKTQHAVQGVDMREIFGPHRAEDARAVLLEFRDERRILLLRIIRVQRRSFAGIRFIHLRPKFGFLPGHLLQILLGLSRQLLVQVRGLTADPVKQFGWKIRCLVDGGVDVLGMGDLEGKTKSYRQARGQFTRHKLGFQ